MSIPGQSLVLYFDDLVKHRVPKMLQTAADALRDTLKQTLNHPGSGTPRRSNRVGGSPAYGPPDAKGKRKRLPDNPADFHHPSVEGEAPAPDTTRLRESSTSVRVGFLAWRVGVSAPGAEALEGKMNRPYFKPALEDWRTKAGRKFADGPRA